MGCDIHAILQTKEYKNSKWNTVATGIIDIRNYTLFGLLAGIRDTTITPISYPKGLPEDIKVCIEDPNGYSDGWVYETDTNACLGCFGHSYLTLDEITAYTIPEQEELELYLDSGINYLIDYMEGYQGLHLCEDIRIVFGFDT